MIARQRTVFDACAHLWRSFICYDIGRPPDTAIPVEMHPAVIEDMTDGPTEMLDGGPVANYDGPRTWTQGEKVELIRNYLQRSGPQTVKQIADGIGAKPPTVTNTLKRHNGTFKIDRYETEAGSKKAFWTLRPVEWSKQ